MASFFSKQGTLRTRLREIQRAPEQRRKLLLTVASAATMAVVVTLWVIYLNLTMPASEESIKPATATQGEGEEPAAGDTFGKTLGRGFSAISGDMAEEWKRAKATADEAFRTLRETLERKNQFTFEAASGTPAAPDAGSIAPVPPAPLPKAPAK